MKHTIQTAIVAFAIILTALFTGCTHATAIQPIPNVYHVVSIEVINKTEPGLRFAANCRIVLQNRDIRITAESVPYCWASGVTIGIIPQVSGQDIILPNEPAYTAASGERFIIVRAESRRAQ
jgi:hypothetical protein